MAEGMEYYITEKQKAHGIKSLKDLARIKTEN
jgi:hypothetical protein